MVIRFRHLGTALLATVPLVASATTYDYSPRSYVCSGDHVIREKVDTLNDSRLRIRVTKTTSSCGSGGSFLAAGTIEIREGSRTGAVVAAKTYAAGDSSVYPEFSLTFTSGTRSYFAIVASDIHRYWDGPIVVTACSLNSACETDLSRLIFDGKMYCVSQHYLASNCVNATKDHRHAGIDIAAPRGTAVHAARDGVLLTFGGDCYNTVAIWNPDPNGCSQSDAGTTVIYLHMDSLSTAFVAGDPVDAGDVLGTVGSKSCVAIGPHLHVEVRRGRHGKATGCSSVTDCQTRSGCSSCAGSDATASVTLDPCTYLLE